jgi:C4-dicarboxylate-specific signal transduction histidine kinase
MAAPLTVPEIANMIGVEAAIIRQTLERRDEDLAPYLHDPDASGEEADVNISSSQPQTLLLEREGLPLLITKLAFNIPTSDIIENLACQVLHLTLVQEENADLTGKNQELQEQNEQLQHRTKELQQRVEALQSELAEQIQLREEAEAASRKGFWGIFGRRGSRGS